MTNNSQEEIYEQDITPPVQKAKLTEPVKFIGPSNEPVEGDFRPTSFVFKNEVDEQPEKKKDQDDQEITEDGHGNMVNSKITKVRHPSEWRHGTPVEDPQQQLDFTSTPEEESESPEGLKKTPGIAGAKQNQQSDE